MTWSVTGRKALCEHLPHLTGGFRQAPLSHSLAEAGAYPFRPVLVFSHSFGKTSSLPRKRLRKRATFPSAVEGMLCGKGRTSGRIGVAGAGAGISVGRLPFG